MNDEDTYGNYLRQFEYYAKYGGHIGTIPNYIVNIIDKLTDISERLSKIEEKLKK